jgi:hypothetical protein
LPRCGYSQDVRLPESTLSAGLNPPGPQTKEHIKYADQAVTYTASFSKSFFKKLISADNYSLSFMDPVHKMCKYLPTDPVNSLGTPLQVLTGLNVA